MKYLWSRCGATCALALLTENTTGRTVLPEYLIISSAHQTWPSTDVFANRQTVRKLIEKVMIQTLFCRMDYQNGSASKTSMIQQVVHMETSEKGMAGKRTFFRFIKQMKICLPICFCVSI